MDTIDRVPQTDEKGIYLKQQLKDKLIAHKQYIDKYGEDLPEIRNWKWSGTIRSSSGRKGPTPFGSFCPPDERAMSKVYPGGAYANSRRRSGGAK